MSARCWAGRLIIIAVALLRCPALFGAPGGRISGTVRDGEGHPLPGVQLTLTNSQASAAAWQSVSRSRGEFAFPDLPFGDYTISAALTGYDSPPLGSISLTARKPAADLDLRLAKSGAGDPSATDAKPEAPKFEAAGVRGQIDSGGYSASAQESAKLGLIEGMATMRRANASVPLSATDEWPCSLEAPLRKSIEADPTNRDQNLRLARFYLAHNRAAEAIPYIEAARKADPGDYDVSKELGSALVKNRQFDSARELLAALAAHHDDAQLHALLALSEEGRGQFKLASEQYQLAAASVPDESNLFGIGYELILAGLPAEAALSFQSSLKQLPGSIKLLIGAGTAEFLCGKPSSGVDHFLQAIDLDPSDPRPYLFLESASGTERAHLERSRESFQRYIGLAPDNAFAFYGYAEVLWNSQRSGMQSANLEKIQALLERAVALRPDFAKAHLRLGMIFSEKDNYPLAIKEYEAALDAEADMREAHYRLAIAYKHIGKPEQAAREMQLFEESRTGKTLPGGAPSSPAMIEELRLGLANPPTETDAREPCSGSIP